MTAPTLSPEALKRMKRIEQDARSKTKRDGQHAEFVSVEAIWLLHGGKCCCSVIRGEAGCDFQPINPEATGRDPDAATLAHVEARKRKLKGAHTPENCRWWRYECNAAMAATENHDDGVARKMGVSLLLKPDALEEANATIRSVRTLQSRGFRKDVRRRMDGTTERVET